ncbi:hypothetical protein M885DRAFT_508041 [Pelagophyceae sp. CCMP2097]|nr:hypothetical protein M885DRAFT_508041 [Pelagophyceae sp. CCMP2097]
MAPAFGPALVLLGLASALNGGPVRHISARRIGRAPGNVLRAEADLGASFESDLLSGMDSARDTPAPAPAPAAPAPVLGSSAAVLAAAPSANEELAQRIVTCGNCKAVYPLDEMALGDGNGARVKCAVCGNVWFQSNARINRLYDNYALEPYPMDKKEQFAGEKVQSNQPPVPKKKGAATLFVANIPFRYRDDDLAKIFDGHAEVASATVITDDTGRSRGFGFVDLVEKPAADVAIEALNGVDIEGREIIVRVGLREARPCPPILDLAPF